MSYGNLTIDFGILHTIEMDIAIASSKIPEVDAALRETEKHLQAAQVSLKTVFTFRPKMEE